MTKTVLTALSLAVVLSSASVAMAAHKHPVRHQTGPAIEQPAPRDAYAAYGYRVPGYASEPTYMWIQDRNLGTGE